MKRFIYEVRNYLCNEIDKKDIAGSEKARLQIDIESICSYCVLGIITEKQALLKMLEIEREE